MIEGPSAGRWVVGYEQRYMVFRDGRILNRAAREMTQRIDRYGYANVRLNVDARQSWKKVHRLVCEAWHGPPPGPEYHAAHLDGDPLNNNADNLAWASPKENNAHKKLQGRPNGGRDPLLSATAIEAIRSSHLSSRKAAAEFGVSQCHVVRIRNGTRCAGIALTPFTAGHRKGI